MARPPSLKYKYLAYCCFLSAAVLVVMAIAGPFIVTAVKNEMINASLVIKDTHKSSDSSSNDDSSKESDIIITKNEYIYNVTNIEDVLYKGKKPILD